MGRGLDQRAPTEVGRIDVAVDGNVRGQSIAADPD